MWLGRPESENLETNNDGCIFDIVWLLLSSSCFMLYFLEWRDELQKTVPWKQVQYITDTKTQQYSEVEVTYSVAQ